LGCVSGVDGVLGGGPGADRDERRARLRLPAGAPAAGRPRGAGGAGGADGAQHEPHEQRGEAADGAGGWLRGAHCPARAAAARAAEVAAAHAGQRHQGEELGGQGQQRAGAGGRPAAAPRRPIPAQVHGRAGRGRQGESAGCDRQGAQEDRQPARGQGGGTRRHFACLT